MESIVATMRCPGSRVCEFVSCDSSVVRPSSVPFLVEALRCGRIRVLVPSYLHTFEHNESISPSAATHTHTIYVHDIDLKKRRQLRFLTAAVYGVVISARVAPV